MSERLREMELNGEFPRSWKPRPMDQVSGTVVQYSDAEAMAGPCKICTIEQDDREFLSIWLTQTVLVGEFAKKNPRIGERITVRYLGQPEGKNYKKYAVVVHRDQPSHVDFQSALGTAPPAEIAEAAGDPSDPFADQWDDKPTPYAEQTMRGSRA